MFNDQIKIEILRLQYGQGLEQEEAARALRRLGVAEETIQILKMEGEKKKQRLHHDALLLYSR